MLDAMKQHQHNKGIVQTFYTILIAFISIALLVLILVLFIQKNYDIRLTVQETEQDRAVINLAQALLSSDKLVYVDSDSVIHRGVIDAEKIKDVDMDNIREDMTYPRFYYTVTITDLDKNVDIKSPSADENIALVSHDLNRQVRKFPVAIRYIDGTVDAGAMSISGGFMSPISSGVIG
jgi:hypothetical protein